MDHLGDPDVAKVFALSRSLYPGWQIKAVFELRANNGEIMLVSNEYSTVQGAKNGIATYKKSIAAGNFNVVQTKAGDFIFRLTNAQKRLLCVSSNYNTQDSCESAVESTKRWALTDYIETPEE